MPKHFAMQADNTLPFPPGLAGEEGQCYLLQLIHMEIQGCYSAQWNIEHCLVY